MRKNYTELHILPEHFLQSLAVSIQTEEICIPKNGAMGVSSVMLYSATLRGKLSVLVLHLPKLAELLSRRQQVRNGLYKVPKQDVETDCFGLLGLVGLGFLLLQVCFFFSR